MSNASSTKATSTEDKLKSEIKKLQQKLEEATKTGGIETKKKSTALKEWQLKNVGPSTKVNGRTWWWWPRHNDGKGLYVRHKPENHEKWEEAKKKGERFTESGF